MSDHRSSIRTWALVVVGATSAFLIGISIWLTFILSAPDWCNRAVGAAKYVDGRPAEAIQGCFGLLSRQVKALALNSHIAIGIIALCLLVLVVIILAGGRVNFTASKDGVSADIGRERAAKRVADAARDEAEQIKQETP